MTRGPEPRNRLLRHAALLAAAALAAPASAAVGDFQLPPGDTPAPQGPVTEGEAPPRPVTPAPTPTPTAARPTPTPSPTAARPTPTPTARPAQPTPTPTASARVVPTPTPTPTSQPTTDAVPTPVAPVATSAPAVPVVDEPTPLPATVEQAEAGLSPIWQWLGAALAVVGFAIAGFVFLRRRRQAADAVPAIERPRVVRPEVKPSEPPAAPEPPPPPEPARNEPLSVAIEARSFTISLSAATLAYRLTISNTSGVPIGGITVSGDLVSAHASLPTDQQIAMADVALPARHTHERLMPGESVQLSGELRLPFALIRPIRKGNAAFLVPLARFRVENGSGVALPLLRTTLVGIRPTQPGGVLQPFRLDQGPRIYREVTQKIFS